MFLVLDSSLILNIDKLVGIHSDHHIKSIKVCRLRAKIKT